MLIRLLVITIIVSSSVYASDCDYGMELLEKSSYDEAIALLESCCDSQNHEQKYCVALCESYISVGAYEKANVLCNELLNYNQNSPDTWYYLAITLINEGDIEGAQSALESGLSFSTDHVGILELSAQLFLEKKEYQQAYGILTHVERLTGGDAELYRTLSEIARQAGLWKLSLKHWMDLLSSTTPAAHDYRTAAELAIVAGDFPLAVSAGANAVAADSSAISIVALGEAHFAAQNIIEAAHFFEMALEKNPDMNLVHFNLANAMELLGNYQRAEEEFEIYILCEPNDPAGYFNLASHHARQGNSNKALQLLDDACALNPASVDPYVLRIELLEQNDQLENAITRIDELIELTSGGNALLEQKKNELVQTVQVESKFLEEGKVKLLHIITDDIEVADFIEQELALGVDFSSLAIRFSLGATAATGGSIGWVDPSIMLVELKMAIELLSINENSPPIQSGKLYHFIKRIR